MTHTPGPWTASWAENGIAALRDSEGKHFANFRNVRGDEISTVNADLAVVLAALDMLAALKALANWGPFQNGYAPDDAFSKIQSMTRAAIAKVEGGAV